MLQSVRNSWFATAASAPGLHRSRATYASCVDLDAALRAHHRRVTRPRRAVWQVLVASDGHLTAQEIAEQVRRTDPGINTSSVYRTLGLLADLDLVRESRLGDGTTSTWESTHDDHTIHLVCTGCGAVVHHAAASVVELHRELAAEARFHVTSIDVRVAGRCADCTTA